METSRSSSKVHNFWFAFIFFFWFLMSSHFVYLCDPILYCTTFLRQILSPWLASIITTPSSKKWFSFSSFLSRFTRRRHSMDGDPRSLVSNSFLE
jgi:hypothetical protein